MNVTKKPPTAPDPEVDPGLWTRFPKARVEQRLPAEALARRMGGQRPPQRGTGLGEAGYTFGWRTRGNRRQVPKRRDRYD